MVHFVVVGLIIKLYLFNLNIKLMFNDWTDNNDNYISACGIVCILVCKWYLFIDQTNVITIVNNKTWT